MMHIEVNTTTATLIPPRESLTPGSVNAVQLEFAFSDEWNGLTKTCVFSNELETVPAEMQNDITSVPTEVLDEVYRWISVGVAGEDSEGTVIIPTIWCRIGQCLPGVSGRFVTIDMLQAYWSKQEIMFELEGDGSRFLGDDGVYHYVSQGGGDVTHEELDAALALKADKDAFDALSATVDDKADKSEIITVTTGDGTKYLADDGTYKTITGGGDVTHDELDAAIAPLATKDEVSAAVAPLATKDELTNATAGLATTAAMNAALALKADKTELASYAKQYDVNQALATKADKTETENALAQKADKDEIITITTGAGTKFLADDGTYKVVQVDEKTFVAEYNVTTAQEIIAFLDASKEPFAPMVVKRGVDYYTVTTAAKQATNKVIIRTFATLSGNYYMFTYTITDGTWASSSYGFQQMLESGTNIKTVGGESLLGSGDIEIPDVSDMLTKTEAGTTYATKTELSDKADKSEIITVTTGSGTLFLADDGTYKPAAGDPPDLSAYLTKTEAGTTYATKTELADKADASALADYETTAHAEATYATKAELPDTSDMLTKTEASATYATQTELSDYAKQSDIITVTTGDGTQFLSDDGTYKRVQTDLSSYLTKTEAEQTYATQTEVASKADKSEIITVTTGTGTLFLADDGTYKPAAGDPPDLSAYLTKTEASTTYETQVNASATYATKTELADYETTAHAEATYATKTELANKADTATVDSALALKADKTELADYETSEHAAATYATKTELTEGLAGKVDTADIADMLTKTEAEGTYADKVSTLTLENTVDAQRTLINNLDTNKADKTQIITVTTGTGTLFLADDGTYKPAAGDPPDLSAYLTKTEAGTTYTTITHAEATYATKEDVTIADNELQEAIDLKADASALADYETTAHASATYATKAELPDVSDMLTKTEAGTTYATKTELDAKADSATVTALSGVVTGHTASIAALETGKADKSELPDVSDMLTKTEAGTTYATKTELADKADVSALADYETTAHAEATYETKEDASKIKSVTAAGFAVTPDAAGNVNIGGTDVSRATTSGSWGSEITYTIAQTLPAGATSDTKGGTLTVVKRTENSGATPRIKMTVDGVQLATSADIPDVSHFATTDYVQNTFESTQHAAATYLKISDAAATYQTKTDASPIKSLRQYGTDITVDANGLANIGYTNILVTDQGAEPGEKLWAASIMTRQPNATANGNSAAFVLRGTNSYDYYDWLDVTFTDMAGPTYKTERLFTGKYINRTYATKNEITGMATQTWVQEYIASLDGTNMKF